jgi:putative phosphoribosyl transferase
MGVAPPSVVGKLFPEVTDIICLKQPEPFHSVGFHFQDFSQISDQEVIDLMDRVDKEGSRQLRSATIPSAGKLD